MFLMSYRSGLIIGVGRMHYRTKAIGFVLALFACGGCAGVPQSYAQPDDPCRGSGTSIVVEGKHNLLIFAATIAIAKLAAARPGRAWKREGGDKKTLKGHLRPRHPRRSYSGCQDLCSAKVPQMASPWAFMDRRGGVASWAASIPAPIGRWAVSLWLETDIDAIADFADTSKGTHSHSSGIQERELPLAGQVWRRCLCASSTRRHDRVPQTLVPSVSTHGSSHY